MLLLRTRPDLAQLTKIEPLRSRLSSLSWFMARWKEPIARVCNSEMDTSGHFWEGRFHSRELLDGEAVLTCRFYVDLNQVRAGLADSLLFSVRQRRTCLLLPPACRLAPASHSAAGRSGQLERRVSESSGVSESSVTPMSGQSRNCTMSCLATQRLPLA